MRLPLRRPVMVDDGQSSADEEIAAITTDCAPRREVSGCRDKNAGSRRKEGGHGGKQSDTRDRG
jgi:hypothetical protein